MSTLYVDNIYSKTGTAQALTIDSSGRVTMPARPSFFAYRATGDQSDINYTSATQVNFDATQHNINNCYDTSTYKFTAPVDGIYHFSWQVRMANVTTANYIYSNLRKNNSTAWGSNFYIYANLEDPQGGSYQTPGTSVTVQISAGDEIDVMIVVNGDTGTRIQNNTTFFSGFLVG